MRYTATNAVTSFIFLMFLLTLQPATAQNRRQEVFSFFSGLSGKWTGTLEYVDYSDDSSRTTLPLNASWKNKADSVFFVATYDEGKGKFVTDSTWFYILPDGKHLRKDGKDWYISLYLPGEKETILVAEIQWTDNNKDCQLRERYSFTGNSLSIQRDVRYFGQTDFFRRHEFKIVRD